MAPANFLALACETVAGEFYFTVECPVGGKPVPFERDPDRGRKLYGNPALLMIACPHCRATHSLEKPVVLSFEVARKGAEYRRLGRQLIPAEPRQASSSASSALPSPAEPTMHRVAKAS